MISQKIRKQWFPWCVLVVSLLVLHGCGGGTTGTGGTGGTKIQGRILSPDEAAITQATISILETGDSAVTDAEGNYDIETNLEGSTATLLVEKANSQGSTSLNDIASDTVNLNVDLEFDTEKNSLKVKSRRDTRATPTPKPSKPTPKPGATATPQPLPTVTELTPTSVPSPVSQPTGEPTSEPEPTATPHSVSTPDPVATVEATPTLIKTPASPTPTRVPAKRKNSFRGSIKASSKRLLTGATIQINGSAARRVSSSGSFSVTTPFYEGSSDLTVNTKFGKASVTLPDLPSVSVQVQLTLRLTLIPPSSANSVTMKADNISGDLKLEILSIKITEIGKKPTPIPEQTPAVQ